jgi:glycosyltransferase involved in cell wall biosynthesis
LVALISVLRLMRRYQISLIHSHGKGAGVYSRPLAVLTGAFCVHTFHGVHLERYGTIRRRIYGFYERLFAKYTRLIIAVSHGERLAMIDHLGLSSKSIAIIPNGLPIRLTTARAKEGNGCFSVGIVTRFDPAKNSMLLPVIAQAWCRHAPGRLFRFNIFGDGPEKNAVLALARQLAVEPLLIFHGMVPDGRRAIAGCDALLSTSVREGLPLNLIEAALEHVPIVASDVVGNRDVIAVVGGGLFSLEDPATAARLLDNLASDPEKAADHAKRAQLLAMPAYDARLMSASILRGYVSALTLTRSQMNSESRKEFSTL